MLQQVGVSAKNAILSGLFSCVLQRGLPRYLVLANPVASVLPAQQCTLPCKTFSTPPQKKMFVVQGVRKYSCTDVSVHSTFNSPSNRQSPTPCFQRRHTRAPHLCCPDSCRRRRWMAAAALRIAPGSDSATFRPASTGSGTARCSLPTRDNSARGLYAEIMSKGIIRTSRLH